MFTLLSKECTMCAEQSTNLMLIVMNIQQSASIILCYTCIYYSYIYSLTSQINDYSKNVISFNIVHIECTYHDHGTPLVAIT